MKKTKTILAFALAVAIALAMVPGMALAKAKSASVTITAGSNKSFIAADEKLKVTSDLAETYYEEIVGNEVKDEVSVADVLVAAHIDEYGDAFKKAPDKYLKITNTQEGSYASIVFKKSTGAQLYVNNEGVSNISQGKVSEGDVVKICITSPSDDAYASKFTYFNKESFKAIAGKNFKARVYATGFDENWDPVQEEAPALSLKELDKKTLKLKVLAGTVSGSRSITTKFSTVGIHYISAVEKNADTMFAPLAKVTVGLDKARVTTKKAAKKKATIKWKKVVGAKKYQVYRATKKAGKYKKVATVNKAAYVNKKLKSKKTYYYKVRAYAKVAGKEYKGAFSKVVKVKAK